MAVDPAFQLNPATPDYDGILDQMMTHLATEQSWDNLLTSGTGQTLLRYIASVGDLGQKGIERATQETILDTARLSSSILRISRMLGLHVQRRNPAEITVRVTHPLGTLHVVPAYTQWLMGGINLYNRDKIVIPSDAAFVDVVMYVGQVVTENFTSDGTAFQEFVIGPADFSVGDRDLVATVGVDTWTRVTRGLWRYDNAARVFYENTRPDGRVGVLFGNSIYGGIPSLNAPIVFKYATVPDQQEVAVAEGTLVTPQGVTNVLGGTLSGIGPFQERLPGEFYKTMGPALFSSMERAVTRLDHRALFMTYPGVLDCQVLGQAEINPGDVRWMNVIQATLLTSTAWSDLQWTNFQRWYHGEVGMAALHLYRRDAVPVDVTISLRVRCFNRANLEDVRQELITKITAFFSPRLGALGGEYHASDIRDIVKSVVDQEGPLVDYVDQVLPEESILTSPTQYVRITTTPVIDINYTTRGQPRLITTIE